MKLWQWFKRLISLKPHLYIGGVENPYMLRWYILPRNRWLNLYLHKFMRDDDDRALHDHPWWFVSILLRGSYVEWRERFSVAPGVLSTWIHASPRRFPSIAFRSAETRHRVTLPAGPCWTLVLTGPKKRTWGFWCPKGFVPWFDFVDKTDEGNIGKGCGA